MSERDERFLIGFGCAVSVACAGLAVFTASRGAWITTCIWIAMSVVTARRVLVAWRIARPVSVPVPEEGESS